MTLIRIVLADDHVLVRAGLRSLLEAIGGVEIVAEAGSGQEAIDRAREHRPDVVVMDVAMSDLDGLKAAARIKQELPDTKVLMLSMHSESAIVEEALRAGATGYLVKNAAPEEFRLALLALLRGEVFLSPAISRPIVNRYVRTQSGADASGLTARQLEVLRLLGEGKNTKEIARALAISVKTVEAHRGQLMQRLGARDIANLILEATKRRLIRVRE
jgi:DNA-binding NarL/FixJ family response regulator